MSLIERHICLVCRQKCKTAEDLKRHVAQHVYNVPIYECLACKDKFCKKPKFLMHRHTKHKDVRGGGYRYRNSYICAICGRRFYKKETCVQHTMQHENMVHECTKCKWSFTSPYCLKVHIAGWHSKRKKQLEFRVPKKAQNPGKPKEPTFKGTSFTAMKRFMCPSLSCLLYIGTHEELVEHAAKEHNIVARTCQICTRNFNNDVALQYHLNNHDRMKYKCPISICFVAFEKEKELDAHYKAYHQGREKVAFRKKLPMKTSSLLEPEAVKNNKSKTSKKKSVEVDRKCPMCSRNFCNDTQLIDHLVNHKNMKYRCLMPSCGWEFDSFSGIAAHYNGRHSIKIGKASADVFAVDYTSMNNGIEPDVQQQQIKLYRCQYNDCAYNISGSFIEYSDVLAHHVAEHNEEHDECGVCGRQLLVADLDSHIENHDEMKYQCLEESCGWQFARFGVLFTHCYTDHKITISKEKESMYKIGAESDSVAPVRSVGFTQSLASKTCVHNIDAVKEVQLSEFTCPICGRHFTSQTRIHAHIDQHDRMNYQCNVCKWEFIEFKVLQNHYHEAHKDLLRLTRADEPWYRLQRVDGSGGTRRSTRQRRGSQASPGNGDEENQQRQWKYPCPMIGCQTGCDNFNELDKHLITAHNNVRGYCPLCYRFFRERIKFRVHLDRHITGATWHRCLYDGWVFDTVKSLHTHFKQDHKWPEPPDEKHYDIVTDPVLEDDESTTGYEDSDMEIISVEESVQWNEGPNTVKQEKTDGPGQRVEQHMDKSQHLVQNEQTLENFQVTEESRNIFQAMDNIVIIDVKTLHDEKSSKGEANKRNTNTDSLIQIAGGDMMPKTLLDEVNNAPAAPKQNNADGTTLGSGNPSDQGTTVINVAVNSTNNGKIIVNKLNPTIQSATTSNSEGSEHVMRAENKKIQCAFCNEVVDVETELESHGCYRGAASAGAGVSEKANSVKNSGNSADSLSLRFDFVTVEMDMDNVKLEDGGSSLGSVTQGVDPFGVEPNSAFKSESHGSNAGYTNVNSLLQIAEAHPIASGVCLNSSAPPKSMQMDAVKSEPHPIEQKSSLPDNSIKPQDRKPCHIEVDESIPLSVRKALGLDFSGFSSTTDVTETSVNHTFRSNESKRVLNHGAPGRADSSIALSDLDQLSSQNFDWAEIERLMPTMAPPVDLPVSTISQQLDALDSTRGPNSEDSGRSATTFTKKLFDDENMSDDATQMSTSINQPLQPQNAVQKTSLHPVLNAKNSTSDITAQKTSIGADMKPSLHQTGDKLAQHGVGQGRRQQCTEISSGSNINLEPSKSVTASVNGVTQQSQMPRPENPQTQGTQLSQQHGAQPVPQMQQIGPQLQAQVVRQPQTSQQSSQLQIPNLQLQRLRELMSEQAQLQRAPLSQIQDAQQAQTHSQSSATNKRFLMDEPIVIDDLDEPVIVID